MSIFSTINTAASGMRAQQKALEVTSHNVANANTAGYHRQEAVQETLQAYPVGGNQLSSTGGQFGTGVEVQTVRRMQNNFVYRQMQSIESQLGRWSMAQDSLRQLETVLSPGPGLDMSATLDRFFAAWQTLANHPEEIASRMAVRTEGVNLANSLNLIVARLDGVAADTTVGLPARVDRINLLSDELASLNAQISLTRGEGRAPNDLLDQRGRVLSEITTLTGATTLAQNEGDSITNLGGRPLVQGNTAYHLTMGTDANGVQIITWEDSGAAATFPGGEVAGLLEVRDSVIPAYRQQLDTLTSALVSAVNNLHTQGFTMGGLAAGNFFEGDSAGSIAMNANILANAANIAASRQTSAIGDGALANDIRGLISLPLVGSQTLHQVAQSVIGQIGNAVKTADTSLAAGQALKEQLDMQEMETSGVSIDEEMTNMLMYQRAYDASARMLIVADQMLQTLLETVR